MKTYKVLLHRDYIVNIDAKNQQEITLDFAGSKYKTVTGRILTSGKVNDFNSAESPEKIKPAEFKGAKLKEGTLTVTVPPFSVIVLELK